MKKISKILAIMMILCLLFSTAVFADGEEEGTEAAPEAQKAVGRWDRGCRQLPFAPDHGFDVVTLDDVAWKSGEYSGEASGARIPSNMPHFDTPKEIPLLVLVIGFDNIDYQDSYDWGAHIFEGEKSLAQYYQDMSFNQFAFVPAKETSAYGTGDNTNTEDVQDDGVVHVKLAEDHGNWASDDDYDMADYTKKLVQAIWAADEYVDFASFDKNEDGELTNDEFALAVVVAGYEGAFDENCTYGEEYYLWSFAWNIYSAWYNYSAYGVPEVPDPDGVYVDSYITIPEQLVPGKQEPISVLAHELGHYLGLPDLYTTDYEYKALWGAYDVGYLSVMCSGSWGYNAEDGEYYPVAFDAWSRSCLGWVEPETVQVGSTYNVESDKGTYNVLRVDTGIVGDYYLLENREFSGWDAGLAITGNISDWPGFCYAEHADNGGLICWHVDDEVYDQYAAINEVNNTYHRPALMPLFPEYDANGALTFAGEIDFFEGTAQPFFTYDIWNDVYAGDMDKVEFPTYNGSDRLQDRDASGVEMTILPETAEHAVTVSFGGITGIERIAGPNRYSTARRGAIAYLEKTGRSYFENVIVASGMDYADALAGSYLAVKLDAPILLVNDSTAGQLADYLAGVLNIDSKVYILGGTGAVSDKLPGILTEIGLPEEQIIRLAGQNRYLTNISILNEVGFEGEDLLVCYGRNYADSLSASAVGKPIFLVGSTLTEEQKAFLSEYGHSFKNVYAIGGTGVISDALIQEIAGYVGVEPKRAAGQNRFLTSVAVAEEFFGVESVDCVYLAYARNYPDGLAGGPLAYLDDAPLLLVTDSNYADAERYAASVGAEKCTIMGGKALISNKTASAMLAW